MITERLHRTIEELERLPPEAQEEAATQLEAILQREHQSGDTAPTKHSALDLIGAWSDIPWDEMEAELDHIRHETPPTPPLDADEADDGSKAQ